MAGLNKSGELNTFLIQYVISAYNDKDYILLEEMGVSPNAVLRMKEMSMDEISRLSNFSSNLADIKVDARRFDLMLEHVKREGAKDTLINHMIIMGASQSMLEKLAGVDHVEYRSRRRVLGLPQANAGRPPSLTEEQSLKLLRIREKVTINPEEDELLYYYHLGLESKLPLMQIWMFMKSDT